MLEQPPKVPSFDILSNNNTKLVFPASKFSGSHKLLLTKLYNRDVRNFSSTKLFALDIELLAIPGKTNGDKLIAIKKIFYHIDGFGETFTLLKFLEIIRSSFTSDFSLDKAKKLAISKKILVNNNLKKINNQSDWEVIVKEIPVNFPKLAVESVFSKFEKIVSIKMQLIGLWQKALVKFESSEIANLVTAKWFVFMGKDSICMKGPDRREHPVAYASHSLNPTEKNYGTPALKHLAIYWTVIK
ncbi:hypothetical protein G9A89_012144 [Geosiphon pyriformis]|nr:hypothetical protein G9A89_012144 [Geosiphon pyriformis]